VAERGPRTQDLAEEVKELAPEIKDLGKGMTEGLADVRADLAAFRVEVAEKFGQLGSDLRTDLGKFQGGVERDLRWIKGIGASVLAAVVAGSTWVIRDSATLTAEARNQGTRLEKVEKRLDSFAEKIDTRLDALLRRGEPKPGGETPGRGQGGVNPAGRRPAATGTMPPTRSRDSDEIRVVLG
jgi:hypothetical protein